MSLLPRVVVVHRRSEYDELLARHGTPGAAAYFLRQRGRSLDDVTVRHEALTEALAAVAAAVPADWRRGSVRREDLPRFLFGPEDIVVTVGQDGLVANVAKYLDGQPVVGVDPESGRNPGVLARHAAGAVGELLRAVAAGSAETQQRTMVEAELDDGQTLYGLNEIYVGHAGHQSARYVVSVAGTAARTVGRTGATRRERQSSSGIVIGTGTGATGWCASIAGERATPPALPAPGAATLCWFVREAWPSPVTGTSLTGGVLAEGESLEVACESERLVAFADGLEADHLALTWGQRLTVRVSSRRLNLV
ncbi:MAG: hypothetical protein ACRDT6_19060 [Micromonosporaceae bacterium]